MKNIAAMLNHNCNFCSQMLPPNPTSQQPAEKTKINFANQQHAGKYKPGEKGHPPLYLAKL